MLLETHPSTLPPDVQPAILQEINLTALRAGSTTELEKLTHAALHDGFFYLNLTDPSTASILSQANEVLELAKQLFAYDIETKSLYDIDKISPLKTNGYKPRGRNIISKDGARDGFESWALPQNSLLSLTHTPFPHPPLIASSQPTLKSLLTSLSSTAQTIFTSLSLLPSIPPLESFHQQDIASPTLLRLLKYAPSKTGPESPLTPHTDLGSLTFVFTPTPGLQVLQDQNWAYVAPREGCAVVNLGDCLSMLTSGVLKSAVHRVGPLPGRGMEERYSVAYLMRPGDEVVLGREGITCAEWIGRKFGVLRGGGGRGDEDEVITGGRRGFV